MTEKKNTKLVLKFNGGMRATFIEKSARVALQRALDHLAGRSNYNTEGFSYTQGPTDEDTTLEPVEKKTEAAP